MSEIADRRNELAGNLSLYQELHFIEKVDTWLDEGILVGERYRPITVRVLEMTPLARLTSVVRARPRR